MSLGPRPKAISPVDRVLTQAAIVGRNDRQQMRTLPQQRASRVTNFTQTSTRTLTAANRQALAIDIPVNVGSPDAPTIANAPPAGAGAFAGSGGGPGGGGFDGSGRHGKGSYP